MVTNKFIPILISIAYALILVECGSLRLPENDEHSPRLKNEDPNLTSKLQSEDIPGAKATPFTSSSLMKDLLEKETSASGSTTITEDFRTKLEKELVNIRSNARSYLDGIRTMLESLACRVGLQRFCDAGTASDNTGANTTVDKTNSIHDSPQTSDEPKLASSSSPDVSSQEVLKDQNFSADSIAKPTHEPLVDLADDKNMSAEKDQLPPTSEETSSTLPTI